MKILIVGGVAGGASAAARLRRLDEKAQIILFERGNYISFANCGLPYYIGGEIKDKRALTLQTPESFNGRFCVDVRIMSEVTSVNAESKEVTVFDRSTNKEYKESYDKLILSPGAEPFIPKMDGIDSEKVFTVRNIPDTLKVKSYIETAKPKTAAIIGAGYIGLEMAENLKSAGLHVSVIELANHVIAPIDYDMAADVQNYLYANGIDLHLGKALKSIKDSGNSLTLDLGDSKITADMVIMSVGVKPETEFLKGSGIALNPKGAIIVDEHMKTSKEDIYAVGDAVEIMNFVTNQPSVIPLAGPANKQGRIAADNIVSGDNVSYKGTQGSSILKIFDMTVAVTGINESQAKAFGYDYDKTFIYSASHATYYPNFSQMSIKLIWDKKTLKILGAQIVGFDGVDKRMDVIATAMRLSAKVTDLKDLELCYAPPFGSAKDPVNMVGFVAENVVTGKIKQFFPEDVANLKRDGSVFLLDVRTTLEAQRGMIDGFTNIPLDVLRENLHRIPKDKPVYVHCHSGLRSYIACRILAGNGYDCYNLAGGYRLYSSIENQMYV